MSWGSLSPSEDFFPFQSWHITQPCWRSQHRKYCKVEGLNGAWQGLHTRFKTDWLTDWPRGGNGRRSQEKCWDNSVSHGHMHHPSRSPLERWVFQNKDYLCCFPNTTGNWSRRKNSTWLLSFLLPLLLISCTRSHSPAATATPLKSGISVRGQRWAAGHGNSFQQFGFRVSFSLFSCCQVQAFACNAAPQRHKPLARGRESLKSKINNNAVILPLLHNMSRPLLAVLGVGCKEDMHELKRPGRSSPVWGELTWWNM